MSQPCVGPATTPGKDSDVFLLTVLPTLGPWTFPDHVLLQESRLNTDDMEKFQEWMALSSPMFVTVRRVLDLVLTWFQQQLCGCGYSAKPTALIN